MLYHHVIGKGPDLVLLHGFGFHHGVWRMLVPALTQHYTVHLIDLPGHGRSQNFTMPETLDSCCESLLTVLPKKAHYLGWSLGGVIAGALLMHCPSRVSGLTVISGTPCFLAQPSWRGVQLDVYNNFQKRVASHPEKALRYFILLGLATRTMQKKFASMIQQCLYEHPIPTKISLLNALKLLATTDLRHTVLTSTCPVQYYIPDKDPLTCFNFLSNTERLAALGHFPLFTHPKAVLDALL